MRVLITGVNGFAGSHLADYLLATTDWEVWGCGLMPAPPDYLAPEVQYTYLDLRDPGPISALLQEAHPNRIYHLAGQAFVPESWDAPWATFEGNVLTTLNVLESVRKLDLRPRIIIVSSVEVYGAVRAEDLPLTESNSYHTNSPYSVSKVAQDLLGLSYAVSHGLHVIRARPLNHIGPRQNERFVAAAFARQLARIEAGLQPPTLRVGDLSARRDFTDVRDMVRAYYLLLEDGEPGEAYNVASGQLRPIQALLDQLLTLSPVEVDVKPDPTLYRSVDTPSLAVDCSKLRAATGWQPEIPFEQTLRDLLDYERARVQTEKEVYK